MRPQGTPIDRDQYQFICNRFHDVIVAVKESSKAETELTRLRDSLTKLVEEWREKEANQSAVGDRYSDRDNQNLAEVFYRESDTFKACADKLQALIEKPPVPPTSES